MSSRRVGRVGRVGALLCISLATACASSGNLDPGPDDPVTRLRELLEEWNSVRASGGSCASGGRSYPFTDCGRIQAAIERLGLDFPSHPEILLANAVIAFETHQPEKAQSYLDALLELDPMQPGVAVLRGRIAIQQGNLPFARRLLEEHVQLAPDSSELREALASVHYLLGDLTRARRELEIAERLGAPRWRVAYHRGLLEEADGKPEAAIDYYRRALEGNPGWDRARARLRGLESERGL